MNIFAWSIEIAHYIFTKHSTRSAFFYTILLTPPVLYVNRVFFMRGFAALIRRAANMDSLVAVGSSAAVIYGVAMFFVAGEALGRGDHETVHNCMSQLYFESAAMIRRWLRWENTLRAGQTYVLPRLCATARD